ncbi:MAG TPA: hypothetical protein VEO55_01560, partial [Candidatus Dormibacteraeota bacterium]|nr:hypothetical protein [Candidatus Dormibacteraeota bacterium]
DRGGLIVLISSSRPVCCFQMNEAIRRLDGITGDVTWEFQHREMFARFSEVAIHPKGHVFFVEKLSNANTTDLVSLDGLTGAERGRWDLTFNHVTYPNASNATGPIVQDDGSVVVIASRWDNLNTSSAPRTAWLGTLPDNPVPVFNLQQLLHADGTTVNLGVGDIISGPWPDGHGGFTIGNVGSGLGWGNLVHIGPDLIASSTADLPFGTLAARDMQYVLGDDAAHVLVQYWEGSGQTGAQLFSVNPITLGIINSTSLTGGPRIQLTSAIAGGGSLMTSPASGSSSAVGYGALGGWNSNAPVLQTAATPTIAETNWPYRRGVTGRNDASNPRLGIFFKAQWVVPPITLLHTSLRIVPRNQIRWAGTPGFRQNPFGDWYLTIAAESDTGGCSGLMKSEVNRPDDLDVTNFVYRERLHYSLDDEEAIVNGLLRADFNYSDRLSYACLPTEVLNTYNSNSYSHGLLNKVGLASPLTPFVLPFFHTGWSRPVPSSEFDPGQ